MDKGSGKSMIKAFEKHARRGKERILQNLGKADKTKDELFDEYTQNFTKQQKVAEKYQRELRNYITYTKAVETSILGLIDTISEIYEDDWVKKQEIGESLEKLLKIQNSYNHKLHEEVLGSVNSYLSQFPEIKNKVSKRGRKLMDYDGARHSLESLQNHRRKEETKIQKATEQMEIARQNFEPLNAELLDELPALYSSRIPFYASNLHNLFSAEMTFHHDSSEVYSELSDIIEFLAKENKRSTYPPAKTENSSPSPENASPISPTKPTPPPSGEEVSSEEDNPAVVTPAQNGDRSPPPVDEPAKRPASQNENTQNRLSVSGEPVQRGTSPRTSPKVVHRAPQPQQAIPDGATLVNLPPGVLYRVRTMHRYQKEDADELTFEKDEIIRVVEYDDPEEREEGWLMGIHEPTMQKGLFPANFTKPI